MTMSRADLNLTAMSNSYNKDLKACIPKYNIKTTYTSNLSPFFSPKKGHEPIEQFVSPEIDLTVKDDKKASSKGFGKGKKGSQKDESSNKPTPMSVHTTGSPLGLVNNPQNIESQVTISGIHIDPEELKKRMEHQEVLNQLTTEKLPGTVKTKWALGYRMQMDKAIEDALSIEETAAEKVKTKGRFQI